MLVPTRWFRRPINHVTTVLTVGVGDVGTVPPREAAQAAARRKFGHLVPVTKPGVGRPGRPGRPASPSFSDVSTYRRLMFPRYGRVTSYTGASVPPTPEPNSSAFIPAFPTWTEY